MDTYTTEVVISKGVKKIKGNEKMRYKRKSGVKPLFYVTWGSDFFDLDSFFVFS